MTDDSDEASERRICIGCVREDVLRKQVVEVADEDTTCSYCGRLGQTISIDDLADFIEEAIERHFYRTSTEPEGIEIFVAKEGLWERKGQAIGELISDVAGIGDDAAQDVRSNLEERNENFDHDATGEENPFDEDAQYDEKPPDDEELQAEWDSFEKTLKTENRFFSETAQATLTSIFGGVGALKTIDGRSVAVRAGPDTEYLWLFRARSFQNTERLRLALMNPDRELGSPPAIAAKAGRMNAQGISMFYGSTNALNALSEVRPPVGSRVLVGRFAVVRRIRLLDLAAMLSIEVVGSYFDPEFMKRLAHAQFLRRVSRRMSTPVMPDDENSEYLITQAIADYLATQVSPRLDGIIYPSIQSGVGHNVVLFHKAARVDEIELPTGTVVSADIFHHTEEGTEPDYWVAEVFPPPVPAVEPDLDGFDPSAFIQGSVERPYEPIDSRLITLRLDLPSLSVYHIRSASFETSEFAVTRHRRERRDPDHSF
jgi:RES domain/HEPN/RES N-terminal domain 1